MSFPEIDNQLVVYRTDGKKDINKGRTAEKLHEVLGMSEPVALAAACAICCASRDLSRLLRHDVVREETDESVPVEQIVQNFFYGPVMATLAVKTSSTSRFMAYIRYKDEEKGTWVKTLGPTSRDAREIVELKLMATGGWSEKIKSNKRTSAASTQSSNREPEGPISADQTVPSSRTIGSFLVPSTYMDPGLVSGRSTQNKPTCAKEYDPPDGEYLVHATDINSVVSIFRTGLVPGSIQKERAKHLQSLVPAQGTENGRTTVQFAAISNSKHDFLVRDKKDILLVFSGAAIAASYDCWEVPDKPIISTPCQIRPDLILAALTANHVLYEDEACPTFVVQKIAFWWSNYLRERDLNLYDQGLATVSQLTADKVFQPRKLVQASASACQRDAAKSKKPPSHLRGKQIAAWKAENDPDSLEAKLNPTGAASSTATYKVTAPPPPPPPASSAAVTAESIKQEEKAEKSELSDKGKEDDKMEESELSDKDKEKADDSDSEVSSIGDDIPAEAEDQDSAEEADVAQRLVKHRSVNPGQEKVLCQDETGKTVTLTAGEAATAKPVSELSDEGNESEELIEDDPTVDPSVPRVWKGKQHPPEPVAPSSPKETNYRPVRQKRQNKIPNKGKKKAYFECPEANTPCTYCGYVTDLYCRKCGDTACSECRNTDLGINCGCHNSHICQVDGDSRPICLRAEQEEALQLYAGISNAQAKEYAEATKVWRRWARNQMKKRK